MDITLSHSERLNNALICWQDYLVKQLNYSNHTRTAYHKDVLTFFEIISHKYKAPQDIEDCQNYNSDDFRDFLSMRKNNEISHQSMARNLFCSAIIFLLS